MKRSEKKKRQRHSNLSFRELHLRLSNDTGRPSTFDEETRSVEVVAATEDPVLVYDYERYEPVYEVLLMSGCKLPPSRQIPLLDTHSRYDSSCVVGSARQLSVEGEKLVCRAYFSSAPEAESPYTKVSEGHLTDFSVGYRVIKAQWIPDGEVAEIAGRTFRGPLKVATKWAPRELSICPIGADEKAKARSAEINKKKKTEEGKMDEQTRKMLEEMGLPTDATDDEARAFLAGLKPAEPIQPKKVTPVDPDKIRREATGQERARIKEIDAMGERFGCADLADQLVTDGASIEDARKAILDHLVSARKVVVDGSGHHHPATLQTDERDKFRAAAEDGLLLRGGIQVEEPAAGASELAGFTLYELARKALKFSGRDRSGSRMEIVGRAMTTSDFSNILANVSNKSLFAGYESEPATWKVWVATGSAPDFKPNTLASLGSGSALDEVPESGEYKYGKHSDQAETFQLATYGKIYALTRQAIINDDMSALTDLPYLHGENAARKVADLPYAVLTANSAMSDGIALFHANHSNYVADGSGAAPSETTIGAGVLAMGTQTDPDGAQLNISPQYFVAPKALEMTAEVFFSSNNFTSTDTSSTRANIYGGGRFKRVYDARLDANDAAEWFLAGPKGKTVKLFFLNGVQAPRLETRTGWTVDGVEYKVSIDAAAKAIDWRYLYCNNGD